MKRPELLGHRVVARADLAQERAVHHEVGVAADRRREVAVRAARESRVAEVARVVARLLERAQDERGERLAAALRLLDVLAHALARAAGEHRGLLWRDAIGVGDRRRRHLERGELCVQARDRLRLGRLVDAEERLAASPGEQSRDRLVREDHQLFDQRVRVRLGLEPRLLDAALAVERERDLGARDAERSAREAAAPKLERDGVREPQPLGELVARLLVAGEDPLRLPVRQPLVASDHRAVEGRLAGLERRVERHLDGDAEAVDVWAERACVVGELVREHRRDEPRDVGGERALGGAAVERRAGGDKPRDVRDVHPDADPVAPAARGDRVVEVLRGLGVDRERQEVAQVDAALEARLRQVERLERAAQTLVL
jgi:hypothetical protein